MKGSMKEMPEERACICEHSLHHQPRVGDMDLRSPAPGKKTLPGMPRVERSLLLLLACLLGCYGIQAQKGSQAQKGFEVSGTLKEAPLPFTAMLRYASGGKAVLDSFVSNDGSFRFKGAVDAPTKAVLTIKRPGEAPSPMRMPDEQAFFLENTPVKITASGKVKDGIVTAGKTQQEYEELKKRLKPLEDKMAPLSQKMRQYFEEKNDKARDELFPQLAAIRSDMNKTEEAFIKDFPASYVSLDLVERRSVVINLSTFEPLFNTLSASIKNTTAGKDLARKLAIAKKVDIGQTFINFSLKDTEEKTVTLASQKGKYILLDFWASWCGPCRAENPFVLKAYEKFRDKNFDVVAVSLDDKKDAWMKAIKEDGMPWIHVSDLKGFQSPVAMEYGIQAIPQNFLLDPQGRIIAKNLRGEALEKKLAEILNMSSGD